MIGGNLDSVARPDVIPDYLEQRYWWAYLHPRGLRFFEQQWVINAILWGNYAHLRDAALNELGPSIDGRTLQVACVYGNLTPELAARHQSGAQLDVVDVAPIQLENLHGKLTAGRTVLHCQDAANLRFDDASFDQVLIFFLLHELPMSVRKRAISEALRVLRPGGKLIFVDYHRPVPHHPLRYLMPLVFKTLEPFALDLWREEIADWVSTGTQPKSIKKQVYFGGLYQKVVMLK
ncbi:MAG: rhodoquinone biosynthesis methyltransferase RquA [Gammaproteobacteria bacterium]|nr:rhodoquinone biosynthesis methyltransferase RquA [Gammaproteobacteria bacterium]